MCYVRSLDSTRLRQNFVAPTKATPINNWKFYLTNNFVYLSKYVVQFILCSNFAFLKILQKASLQKLNPRVMFRKAHKTVCRQNKWHIQIRCKTGNAPILPVLRMMRDRYIDFKGLWS